MRRRKFVYWWKVNFSLPNNQIRMYSVHVIGYFYGDLPAYFDTNSCAEFHWKLLLELLIKYYVKCTNEDEKEVRNKLTTDFKKGTHIK